MRFMIDQPASEPAPYRSLERLHCFIHPRSPSRASCTNSIQPLPYFSLHCRLLRQALDWSHWRSPLVADVGPALLHFAVSIHYHHPTTSNLSPVCFTQYHPQDVLDICKWICMNPLHTRHFTDIVPGGLVATAQDKSGFRAHGAMVVGARKFEDRREPMANRPKSRLHESDGAMLSKDA
jgi:hypothetical protein